MDAEDEGAPTAPSPPPPLQQHSIDDMEVVGEVEAAVAAAEDTGGATEETQIADSENEGVTGMQVMEDKVGDGIVEKGNESGQEEHAILEGTHGGDAAKVEEEETRSAIDPAQTAEEGEDKVVEVAEQMELANEAASTEERAEAQGIEQTHEDDEEEADAGCGVANEAAFMEEHEQVQVQEEEGDVGGGIANEAVFMVEHEQVQEQEEEGDLGVGITNGAVLMEGQEEVQEDEADVGGGIANEAAFMEEQEEGREEEENDVGGGIANEAAFMEEQEEGREEEENDVGGGIANDVALMEEHGEGQGQGQEEQADAGDGIADETDLMEEHEEGHEDDQEEDEEEADDAGGAGGSGGMGGDAEGTEETEEVEEQSTSVSGGKRKRGAGKNSKSTGRVPSKKKVEEDVCFICFDGGDLVLCDRRGCPKAYHPSCVNRDEAFFRAKGKWNCGWHLCSKCEKNAYYMCYTCTFSLCKGCIKDAVILCVRGNKGFCETCMRTVMLIEQNNQGNNMGQVDFDDRSSWEYLFKDYYIDLKEKLSLTFDELTQAKNPWKGSDVLPSKEESADELFDTNNDRGSDSDSSYENLDLSRSKRRKGKKRTKSRSKEGSSYASRRGAVGPSADESSEWASKELLEFVMHMRNGDKSILSQFDVQALLLEYIKRNKLRDPRRKSQIVCDARLQNLFGKPRVGHFEMLKLLESHFLLKEDSQAEDLQGSVVDTEVSHLEGDGNSDSYVKGGKDKRRKTRKKGDERGLQSNVDDYAAIDNHNINLIYLRRNLVEELLEDTEKFHDRAIGSFVRIRISGAGQKQDLYRLVQVVGTCKAADTYKVGKRVTDILLEILNLNKTEIVSMDIISNQEFTEDECKRLRQSIKCGLINRLTVGDIQEKALALQAVRVNDWLETEIVRLSHLRDRASEKGRRKELRECVEKLQLLKTPEERQRRLEEIPEIHVDPNMDPSYESEEDEDEMDEKRQENFMRPRGSAGFGRRGREIISPRSGSISSDSWSGTRNYSNVNRELSRNLSNKGFAIKGDDISTANEVLNDAQLLQGRDRGSQSHSLERQKLSSSFESGAKNNQPLVTPESLSTAVLEASASPSSAGIAPPAMKINETEKMWYYQDPSGKVQGPFSMVQLRKWSNTGYFPADLRIWKASEKQDQSILLTDALAGKYYKEPSMVDKTFPKAQSVLELQYSSLYSGKSPLAAQATEGQVGGRPTFDQNSGSRNTLGSPGQHAGGSWRSNDNMNSSASRPSPLAVEVPKNPANGWGSDAGVRNEATNLPSPTPQIASGGTNMQAFENNWSPTPVQFSGGAESGSSSQSVLTAASKSEKGMILNSTDTTQVLPHAAAAAPFVASGVDIQTAGANSQNQVVNSHNSRAEAHQGWGSGMVSKPEVQAWGGTQSQRIEPNNPATMPAQPASHGLWVDASSAQNSASFSTGNPTGSFPTPGFPGMTAPESWRPPTSNSQSNSNIAAAGPPNIPWGMGVMENQNAAWGMPGNQNMNWGGSVNVNVNWMQGQVPAPGNATPGWGAPSQGPPPVNAAGWGTPGQARPRVNANAGWVVPGQGPAPGGANPGWASSTGNQGTWGGDQNRNGDRFPGQGDRGTHGGDSGHGGKSWNRQSSFSSGGRGGGGSSRPPFGGQRGVCRFHESGHCKKGASCDFMHTEKL